MTRPSEPRLLVLHGLRLKGFAMPEDVAAAVDVDTAVVETELASLQDAELVLFREGRLTGWALTAAGRAEQERLLGEELEASGGREVVTTAYKRFLDLNPELLGVCTAWQMKDESTLNAHDDPAYDGRVVDDLHDLHVRLEPLLEDLEGQLLRYHRYRPRLCAALDRVRAGEHDWFAKPMIDSYHTVWFQLHEDLLNTLGIDRSKESLP